jgi:IS5 family transposase
MHCNPDVRIVHRGKSKRLSAQESKLLERRQAIEPIIGHLKADHRMDRCHLKGETGDRLHAVLCAAGYNIRWLLRMIAKKGIRAMLAHLLRLLGWPRLGQNRSG